MQICPVHSTLSEADCTACLRDFLGLLGANDLVSVRPPGITDDRDLPLPTGPTCGGMNHDSAGNEVVCERPERHEGDCDDGTGFMWDHDENCGCFDGPAPVSPLVEPRQHDFDDDARTCRRADDAHWLDRDWGDEPDDPSDHYRY